MNEGRSVKSSLFLMELITAIFFFALCAATCLRIFASAYTMNQSSRNLDQAVYKAESIAEIYKSTGGNLIETAAMYGGYGVVTDNKLRIRFDKDWKPILQGQGSSFELELAIEEIPLLKSGWITLVKKDGEVIFRLPVKIASGGVQYGR